MCPAITAGVRKMPLPIVEPTSTATALSSPSLRGSRSPQGSGADMPPDIARIAGARQDASKARRSGRALLALGSGCPFGHQLWDRSARLEHERIGHDDRAAALGLGERPAADRLGDARTDRGI